jgi:hypothetical protein
MNNEPMLVMFTGGDLLSISNYRCATPAEIMAAHPKCGECRNFRKGDSWEGDHCVLVSYYRAESTDYCNKWEAK